MSKKSIIFIGSFVNKSKSGHVGGQMYACTTLINSSISNNVNWHLIDSTSSTNKGRSFLSRLFMSIVRFSKLIYYLLFKKVDLLLIFCSNGFSFREKALMARIGNLFGKKTILAPRSGLIKNDIEQSEKFKSIVIKSMNYVDVILCQGESWQKFYRGLCQNKTTEFKIIHNWIDVKPYININKSTKSTEYFNVVFIGWITKNKGVYDLLEAARQLKNEKITFYLAGDGDEFEKLQEKIIELDLQEKFLLLGWVTGTKKFEYLKIADTFVLPSYREGYPNALIEAMASKTAVISTKVGSIPDLITDEKNGFLIEPGDTQQMARLILTLKDNPKLRIQIATNAQQRILENNSVEKAINSFEEILTC